MDPSSIRKLSAEARAKVTALDLPRRRANVEALRGKATSDDERWICDEFVRLFDTIEALAPLANLLDRLTDEGALEVMARAMVVRIWDPTDPADTERAITGDNGADLDFTDLAQAALNALLAEEGTP